MRYFTHVNRFRSNTAYVRVDGDGECGWVCVAPDGTETHVPHPWPLVSAEYNVRQTDWKEITESEAKALVKGDNA